MPFLTQGPAGEQAPYGVNKTNWKYIIVVVILAGIVGGGILSYLSYFKKEMISIGQFPEIKKPEKLVEERRIADHISPDGNFVASQPDPYSLILTNLITQEQKEFNFYNLAASETISYLEETHRLIEEGIRGGINIWIDLGKWSSDSKDFWGFIHLAPAADPPVPEAASLFRINVKDWEVEKFSIPDHGGVLSNFLSPEALNIEKGMVLFEDNANGGITLYLYNLRSKEEKTIVL